MTLIGYCGIIPLPVGEYPWTIISQPAVFLGGFPPHIYFFGKGKIVVGKLYHVFPARTANYCDRLAEILVAAARVCGFKRSWLAVKKQPENIEQITVKVFIIPHKASRNTYYIRRTNTVCLCGADYILAE